MVECSHGYPPLSLSKFLPKNLSYENDKFQNKQYLSCKICSQNSLAGMENGGDVPISNGNGIAEDEDLRDRSCSIQSNSSQYSEDYTRMTDVDDTEEVVFSDKLTHDGELELAHLCEQSRLLSLTTSDTNDSLSPDDTSYVEINNLSSRNSRKDSLTDGGFYDGDGEFDFLKTERVRRSTSLKTSKTPPGTPSRKKAVRFADALGLDLESVKTILNKDVPPKIPSYATRDLDLQDDVQSQKPHNGAGGKYLSACFPQPGARADFRTRVATNKVMLENCLVDDKSMTVTGMVRVANIAFEKSITIRYTVNRWTTSTDVLASYVANSNDGPTDRFSFTINIPHYFTTGSRLEFAILFTAGGNTYWDSNNGSNYCILCYAETNQSMESSTGTSSWISFM